MTDSTLEKNEIIRLFAGKIHCSQIVAGQWADYLGMDKEELVKMAAGFGGGCFDGELCGSVAGAMMVIGAEYGHFEPGDEEGNARLIEKAGEFKKAFKEKFGSLTCRELTGYDFSIPGDFEKAVSAGVTIEKCPDYVNGALEILDEIMG